MVYLREARTYRDFGPDARFKVFRVVVETSDLYVKALRSLEKETEGLVKECRAQIVDAIGRRPEFLKTLVPIGAQPEDSPIVQQMIRAGKKAGTGPMAAVAGAVAEFVGRGLLPLSHEVIIENGGDLFLKVDYPIVAGIHARNSAFTGHVGLKVEPTLIPLGICTSSGTFGHSLSLGRADAATIISTDAALADAVATGMGNRIQRPGDLKDAVEWAMEIPGVRGALAVLGDKIALLGHIELVPLQDTEREVGK